MAVETFALSGNGMKVYVDTKQLVSAGKTLEQIGKQFNFALSNALNRSATKIRLDHISKMKSVFQSPTPFILNSIWIDKADRKQSEPKAILYFKKGAKLPPDRPLQAEVFGGGRRKKSSEIKLMQTSVARKFGGWIVPTRSEKDASGNMSGARYKQLLSAAAGYDANKGGMVKRGRLSQAASALFFMRTSRYNAVMQRVSKDSIKAVALLNTNSPNYKAVYPFFDYTKERFDFYFEGEFETAWKQAISSAKW